MEWFFLTEIKNSNRLTRDDFLGEGGAQVKQPMHHLTNSPLPNIGSMLKQPINKPTKLAKDITKFVTYPPK